MRRKKQIDDRLANIVENFASKKEENNDTTALSFQFDDDDDDDGYDPANPFARSVIFLYVGLF